MKLHIENNTLTIELEWYEQLWAFTLDRQMRIPLARIERVTTAEPQSNWAEIRVKAQTPCTFCGKSAINFRNRSRNLVFSSCVGARFDR